MLSKANLIPMVYEYFHSAKEREKLWEHSCNKNGLQQGEIKTSQTSSILFPEPRDGSMEATNNKYYWFMVSVHPWIYGCMQEVGEHKIGVRR